MTKPTSDALSIVGLLLTAAGTFVGFGALPTSLGSAFGITKEALLLAGTVLLVAGLGLVIWRGVVLGIDTIRPRPCKLGLQPATKSDLKELCALYRSHFGDEAPTLVQMRSWYRRNPRVFQIIVNLDRDTRRRKIVASFKAVPLKDSAIPFLEMEQMTGSTITEEFIVRPRGRPAAWYVGDLVSTSEISARAVMRGLRQFLVEGRNAYIAIYARPLTQNGLHYLQKFNFEPVGEAPMQIGQICRLLPADISQVLSQQSSEGKPAKRVPQGEAPPRARSQSV